MPGMQGLSIVVAAADPERFRSALEVAAANAALGKPTRLFLQAQAVALLGKGSWREAAPGMPTIAEMLHEAIALGANVSICQTGLGLAGIEAASLPAGVETEGLLGFLGRRGEDQLLMV
jgi:predicted peroxiredoxin